MNDKEKLVAIIQAAVGGCSAYWAGLIADALIANGVTVQKQGRWVGIEYDGYADGYPVYDLWECSECGEEVRGEDVPDTHPWCHGCGAKMDGDT